MAQFFLSYSHNDSEFANELEDKINETQHVLWRDKRKLKYGDNWKEMIDNAIKESLAVILVVTNESKKSEYVTYEWSEPV